MNSNDHSIRDRILAKIEQNELQMHSRAYFALKVSVAVALAVLILLLTVFIGNFVFFIERLNGHGALLSLGTRGLLLFFRVFPWWLMALDVALCAALVWLMRHFQFGYRTPIFVIFFALVAVALLAGFALDTGTPLNDRLLRDADDGALPRPLDAVYKGARQPPPSGSAYRGTITALQDGSLMMMDPDLGATVTVLFPANPSPALTNLAVGQTVFVIGSDTGNGVIQAEDIHPIDARGLPPHDKDPE